MAEPSSPRRGDVWLVDFDPAISGEIQKTRPAVVMSNDTANALLNRVQVVAIASRVARVYPAEALVDLNGERRKVMAHQITTVSKQRLIRKLGELSKADMEAASKAACIQLGLQPPPH